VARHDFRTLDALHSVPPAERRDMLCALLRWIETPPPHNPDVFTWETAEPIGRYAKVQDA